MNKFIVSSSPHFQSKDTTQTLMLDVILALTPAMIASVIIFGFRAAVIILTTVASCILSEYISRRVMKRRQTVGDLSCVVTGVLLAMNLPVSISPIIAAFGGVIAIVVVKQMFGGIGQNFVNPALTARIILMNSFPAKMTAWTAPMDHSFSDAMTTATPLGVLSEGTGAALPSYFDMFLGNTGGCLGETCALALILGGIYLVARRVISPVIPLIYIGTVFVFTFLFGGFNLTYSLSEICAGGLIFGAFFMATDYVTSPLTPKGQIVYGLILGIVTGIFRLWGASPEGVSYAIIFSNLLVPLIERYTLPTAFGKGGQKK